jgi:hypothetical protein
MRYLKPAPNLLEIFSNPRMAGWGLLIGASMLGVGIFFIAPFLVAFATLSFVCAPMLIASNRLLKNDICNSLEEIQKSRQEKVLSPQQEQAVNFDVPAQKKYTELIQASSHSPQGQSRM